MMSMNTYDKILNYTKENNGYVTNKDAEELEINSTFLSNLANTKKLDIKIIIKYFSSYTRIYFPRGIICSIKKYIKELK